MPFWNVIRCMSSRNALYDVKMMPDGVLREDDFDARGLEGCRMLVVPDCWILTANKEEAILSFAKSGAPVIIYGRLSGDERLHQQLSVLENVHFVPEGIEGFARKFEELYGPVSTAQCQDKRIGMKRYDAEDGTFVHLINYDYSEKADRVVPVDELKVTLRSLPGRNVRVYRLDGETDEFSAEFDEDADTYTVTLRNVPVYTVIEVR